MFQQWLLIGLIFFSNLTFSLEDDQDKNTDLFETPTVLYECINNRIKEELDLELIKLISELAKNQLTNSQFLKFLSPASIEQSRTPKKIFDWLPDFVRHGVSHWEGRIWEIDQRYFSQNVRENLVEVAKSATNRKKNRYDNALAFDDNFISTRKDGDIQNYFNASRIDPQKVIGTNFIFPHQFLAGSAPMTNFNSQVLDGQRLETVLDFWKVIWKERVPVIVNLTDFREPNRIGVFTNKSEQYWPDSEALVFGKITVTNKETMNVGIFSVIVLSLRKSGNCDQERIVYLIHYRRWHDTYAENSLKLRKDLWKIIDTIERCFNQAQKDGLDGPVFVHCSAGLRRTGTLLTLAIAKYYIDGTGEKPDIPDMVEKLQNMRFGLVGYDSYFNTIYESLKEYLESNSSGGN